jgi:protein involved in polysaccharide export with SLBB domain
MNKKIILSLVILFSLSFILPAQNINNVNVNNLSDSQIQKIVQEMENRGFTMDQAVILAQSRGATPTQIKDLKRRIQELKRGKRQSIANPDAESTQSSMIVREAFSEKANVKASKKNKRVFGFNLFNNENLTFEPSVNIPTPINYIIGISDEILINVWGASQQTYQLIVDKNGAIQIMDLGPIHVSGMSFKKAKELIKKRLTAIYSGMNGDKPNTWTEVSLGSLRAIKINVIGEINVPGTYNLPSTASAFNALYLSGGPNENGSFRNIKLIRNGKTVKIIDVYDFLINGNTSCNVQLRDQDVIFVPIYNKKIEVLGAFKRNGFFELEEGESLTDLIRYAGNFNEAAYKHRLSITKYTDKEMKIADVEMSEFSNYIPDNGDIVKADGVVNRFLNRVRIAGAVNRPGNYELTEGLTLSQLIKKAEGVKEEFYANRGLIKREKEDKTTFLISFNVNDILQGKQDFKLKKEDKIQIQDIFSMREERVINLTGEVQKTGRFLYHENMTLKDLLFLAGGLKEAASESFIDISRRHTHEESLKETSEMVNIFTIDINRDLRIAPKNESFILKPFDHVYVRRAPSYYEQQTVSVKGEVLYPGPFPIESKNERVSDLLKRAGGFTKFANIEGATLERKYRVRNINLEYLNQLSDTLGVNPSIRDMQADLLELNLKEILKNPGSIYDYKLKEGDVINIPVFSSEIRVVGEVLNPIGLAFEKGKGLKYYINKTGGFTSNAKKSKVYVLYANGTTKTTKNYIISKSYPKIKPGCQIIIPPKFKKIKKDNSGKWMAFASILASLAVAFATVFK